MNYQEIITSHSDAFMQSDIIFDCLRPIGWMIIKFLAAICDLVQSVFDAAYKMLNVLTSKPFLDFTDRFKPAIVIVLSASLIVLGLIYTFSDKKPPIVKNALIGLAIIFMMPEVITLLNDGIIKTKNDLVTNSYGTQSVLSNVTDLKVVANNGFDFTSSLADTLSGTDSLSAIDSSAHIKASQVDGDLAKQVFGHYRTVDDIGKLGWEETGTKGLFEIFDPPYYYRYSIHFFEIILILIGNILIFIFSSYAVVRMEYEIITTKIVATVASMELSSGQKTWKTLEYFFNGYIVLFAIPVILKIYLICQQYINGTFNNGLVRAFLIVICALVVIDGPSTIEKLFGYDMGMSQGALKFMSFVRMLQQARAQHSMSHHNDSSSSGESQQQQQNRSAVTQRANRNNNSSGGGAIAEPKINSAGANTDSGKQNSHEEPNINAGNGANGNQGKNPESIGNGAQHSATSQSGGAASEPGINLSNNYANNGVNQEPGVNAGAVEGGISQESGINNAGAVEGGISQEPGINNAGAMGSINANNNAYNNSSTGGEKEPGIKSGGALPNSVGNGHRITPASGNAEPGVTAGLSQIGNNEKANQNNISNSNNPLNSTSQNGITGQYKSDSNSMIEPQMTNSSNSDNGSQMNNGSEYNPSVAYDSNSLNNSSSNAQPEVSSSTGENNLSQNNQSEAGNMNIAAQKFDDKGNIATNPVSNGNTPQIKTTQAANELKSDSKNISNSAEKLNTASNLNSNNGNRSTEIPSRTEKYISGRRYNINSLTTEERRKK